MLADDLPVSLEGERKMAEISLFDSSGRPIAYIAEDGEGTIYMWKGHAVAYLHGDKVYGFNGHHLGWFDEGIMRDKKGAPVGFTKQTCPRTTRTEPTKYTKKTKKTKATRRTASTRVSNKSTPSSLPLDVFLEGGAK